MCISQVLVEMYKCGDLQELDNPRETESSLSWFWQQIRKGVFLERGNTLVNANSIGQRLVVTTLVHERLVEVTKSVSEKCWTASSVITMVLFIKLCGGGEEADIVKKELIRTKRGRTFVTEGNMPVEGIKVSLTQDCVPDISKLDCYMLHLYGTLEKLHTQIIVLEKAYSWSKQSAIRALQQKDRSTAKRHARSMHTLAASKSKCTEFEGKIQELLAFISQAEMTKQVSEAMKVGTDALKEHTVPLEDIQECLSEVDEAISLHKEAASALGSPTEGSEADDLDLELAELELEEAQTPPMVMENIGLKNGQKLPTASPPSLEAVEHVLKALSLESELA